MQTTNWGLAIWSALKLSFKYGICFPVAVLAFLSPGGSPANFQNFWGMNQAGIRCNLWSQVLAWKEAQSAGGSTSTLHSVTRGRFKYCFVYTTRKKLMAKITLGSGRQLMSPTTASQEIAAKYADYMQVHCEMFHKRNTPELMNFIMTKEERDGVAGFTEWEGRDGLKFALKHNFENCVYRTTGSLKQNAEHYQRMSQDQQQQAQQQQAQQQLEAQQQLAVQLLQAVNQGKRAGDIHYHCASLFNERPFSSSLLQR